MDFMSAVNLALTVVDTIKKVEPIVTEIIKDFTPIAEAVVVKATGKALTDNQREQLKNQIIANHERFQQPIPPEEQQ